MPTPPPPAASAPAATPSRAPGAPPRWLRAAIPAVLVLAWLVAAAIGGPYFGRVDEVSSNEQSSYLPSSADATEVQARLPDFLGDDTVPAVVVVSGSAPLTAGQQAQLRALPGRLGEVAGVKGQASPPILSADGKAAQVFVQVPSDAKLEDVVATLRARVAHELPHGLSGWVTGPAGFTADLSEGFSGIDGLLLVVALVAVFVILIVVYRSPLLPVLVLATSSFALCAVLLLVWWLAKAGVFLLNGQVQGILFILLIGAATDYALLYVARFREAVQAGASRWQAGVRAWRGAAAPILASGCTVIAALMFLLLSDLKTNRALGPIGSLGIAFAMLAALTFLPSLLVLIGKAVFWPFVPKQTAAPSADAPAEATRGLWPRQARFVARHHRAVWVICLLALLAAGAGVFQLRADGVPSSDLVLGHSDARAGQRVLAQHFPAGSGSPVYVLVPRTRVADAVAVMRRIEGVGAVTAASRAAATGELRVELRGGHAVYTLMGPPAPQAPTPTLSRGEVLLMGTLTHSADSAAAEHTVRELREGLDGRLGSRTALVGGVTAIDVDSNDTSIRDRTLIIPIVLAVILVILMLLLRAVLAPVLLILSVIVSFTAAMGVSALVFNRVLDFPGADPAVPLYGFVFLVALGVDYNIFLMTRVREESLLHGTRPGVLRGLVATGGVITSAGLVLASTFAALGVIPILFLAQIAFIVAFGVLLDTFVVRSLLVPAVAHELGDAIWWPSRLARSTPARGTGSGPPPEPGAAR